MFYGSWSSYHSLPSHMSNPVWSYKNEKPTKIGENGRVHPKREFIEGCFVNWVRERKIHGIALVKPSGYKRYIEPRIKLIEQSMLFLIMHFSGDCWTQNRLTFGGEWKTFTSQL